MKQGLIILTCLFGVSFLSNAQEAKEILQKSEEVLRGSSTIIDMKMTIVRPKWTREMQMKVWAKGNDYSLIYLKAPKRDEGTTFLKREKEIWNWIPNIERVVKMPPSMMMQSWMGSDFTNDDLVRSSSVIDDYDQTLIGETEMNDRMAYEIELIPKPDAPVVWGKVKTWISKEDYLQLRLEFYDEDDYLVNVMEMGDIKEMGGRVLPAKMTITPEEEPDNQTIIEYLSIEFDTEIPEETFSVPFMKRVRE